MTMHDVATIAPIPARIASDEEFVPPPQSPRQKEYEGRVAPPSPKTPRVGGGQQGEADAVILDGHQCTQGDAR